MIKLRPYQEEAVQANLAQWEAGNLNILDAMSVGSGKTEIGLATLSRDPTVKRWLWMGHRRELIYQPRDRILEHWPQLGRPGIVMAGQDEYQAQGVIATVQTLASNGRLDKVLSAGVITHLVSDECHHSVSKTYVDIYNKMREHNPELRHLGLTATPKRTDGTPLAEVFDEVAYQASIKAMIKQGALCPFVAMGIQLPVSLAGVRETSTGWDDEQMGEVLKARNAEEIIIETWAKHADDRPTLAFTASVAQAYSLAERFRKYGYAFEALDAKTPKEKRKLLIRQFLDQEIQGLVNVGIFTEGTDLPLASCLIQARPTRSDLLYVQMAGRVFRLYPGKDHALILDFEPADARDMRLAGDLLGKPREQRKAEEKAEKEGIILSCFGINSQGEGIDADPDDISLRILDYLSSSKLAWTFDGKMASATAGERNSLAVVMPDPDEAIRLEHANKFRVSTGWSVAWEPEYQRMKHAASFQLFQVQRYDTHFLGSYQTWDEASDAASDWCDAHDIDILGKKRARWRTLPASDKQRSLLNRLGIWERGLSRGKAAQAITHYFARKALRI